MRTTMFSVLSTYMERDVLDLSGSVDALVVAGGGRERRTEPGFA